MFFYILKVALPGIEFPHRKNLNFRSSLYLPAKLALYEENKNQRCCTHSIERASHFCEVFSFLA